LRAFYNWTIINFMPKPSPKELRELFRYDPETGIVRWKYDSPKRCRNAHKSGDVVGTITAQGYLAVNIRYMPYLLHRIIWAIVRGRWPRRQIDHRNMIRTDNRWINLRRASNSQNSMNRGAQSNNKSGLKGVTTHPDGGFFARITRNGVKYYLGYFATAMEAKAIYDDAAKRLHREYHRTHANVPPLPIGE
jgi:hypothetical protein